MNRPRTYDFPAAAIKVYPDKTCREFPKWCPMINVVRSRDYVANALHLLRQHKRAKA